jgi:hypothetical protein
MASVGPSNYIVVVLHVASSSKASDIKPVLQHKPRTTKALFLAGSILPNEDPIDASVRELFEKTCLTLTVDGLTMLSNIHVGVPLLASKHHLVYVFTTSVPVPYVIALIDQLRVRSNKPLMHSLPFILI